MPQEWSVATVKPQKVDTFNVLDTLSRIAGESFAKNHLEFYLNVHHSLAKVMHYQNKVYIWNTGLFDRKEREDIYCVMLKSGKVCCFTRKKFVVKSKDYLKYIPPQIKKENELFGQRQQHEIPMLSEPLTRVLLIHPTTTPLPTVFFCSQLNVDININNLKPLPSVLEPYKEEVVMNMLGQAVETSVRKCTACPSLAFSGYYPNKVVPQRKSKKGNNVSNNLALVLPLTIENIDSKDCDALVIKYNDKKNRYVLQEIVSLSEAYIKVRIVQQIPTNCWLSIFQSPPKSTGTRSRKSSLYSNPDSIPYSDTLSHPEPIQRDSSPTGEHFTIYSNSSGWDNHTPFSSPILSAQKSIWGSPDSPTRTSPPAFRNIQTRTRSYSSPLQMRTGTILPSFLPADGNFFGMDKRKQPTSNIGFSPHVPFPEPIRKQPQQSPPQVVQPPPPQPQTTRQTPPTQNQKSQQRFSYAKQGSNRNEQKSFNSGSTSSSNGSHGNHNNHGGHGNHSSHNSRSSHNSHNNHSSHGNHGKGSSGLTKEQYIAKNAVRTLPPNDPIFRYKTWQLLEMYDKIKKDYPESPNLPDDCLKEEVIYHMLRANWKWKCELCCRYNEQDPAKSNCRFKKYPVRCYFAHGEADLRPKIKPSFLGGSSR